MKKFKYLLRYLSILVLVSFFSACSINSANTTALNEAGETNVGSDNLTDLKAFIEVQEPVQAIGEPIMLNFRLKNNSDEPLYVLKWFTPLEGIAGNIFEITHDGQEVPYIGILATRGTPTPKSYVFLEPGEEAVANVNIAEAYDFSQPGLYTVKFRSPRISHIARSKEEMATTMDELGPIPIMSNTINIEIADPAASAFYYKYKFPTWSNDQT